MIPKPHDSLEFKVAAGQEIPCSAEAIRFELIGDGAELIDPHLLQNAAAAVLHYFRIDQQRTSITAEEFSAALEKVLHGFGLKNLKAATPGAVRPPAIAEADLCALASDGFELLFFQRLREELRRQLQPGPQIVRFRGLHDCVKHLAGAKRWTQGCQSLHDQIVEFLRTSLGAEHVAQPCGLVVL